MDLGASGITVVAVSKDPVDRAAYHVARDGLPFTLLADPGLGVIRQLGLVHRGGLGFWTRDVLGLPLGFPTGFAEMAIPTTLIVDESGVVRWIDQADDYRIRGDAARVRAAIEQAFGA